MNEKNSNNQPNGNIGVFDSGIGGLTVLKSLKKLLPDESYVYIGDTARLPYGTKSRETVIKYSEALTRAILRHDVKAVVVACNTASTHALEAVTALAAPLPVIGMIEPAAKAACKASKSGHIAVIATSSTINAAPYTRAIKAINPDIKVSPKACQILVALAEEGWSDLDDQITRSTISRYLEPIFDRADAPDTLILGCTHFPVFSEIFTDILGSGVTLINSGEEAAKIVGSQIASTTNTSPTTRFYATDDTIRFAANAAKFYDHQLPSDCVELIDTHLYT